MLKKTAKRKSWKKHAKSDDMEVTENTYASMKHSINASKKDGYVFCYNAPVLIVVANRKDYGNNIADCACAIENMMVAANALDLLCK